MASAGDEDRNSLEPKVKTEHPDPKAAGRKAEGGEDRPGFDLGGSSEEGRKGGPKNTIPGGPRSDVAGGASGATPSAGGSGAGGGPTSGSGRPKV